MSVLEVSEGKGTLVEELPMEIVERKGKGHPDTLCDGAAEELSIALCEYYRENFGRILHHNVDKCVLVGGQSVADFGGGRVKEPIYLLLVGRATGIAPEALEQLIDERIPTWLRRQVPNLRNGKNIIVDHKVRPGSPDLVANYNASNVPRANDTSFAVAFAPFSETEQLVRETELFLNSPAFKEQFPQIGEDIKVMGVRQNDYIRLTVAAAFIARHTKNRDHYEEVRQKVTKLIKEQVAPRITKRKVSVFLNTADTDDSAYLTVTGTSAECGDDGQVGRGNRASGLITPYRPMTLEAVAGKNPVSHVGKIYNITARLIAERVHEQIPEAKQVYCYIVSQIGKPITDPQAVNVELYGEVSPAKVNGKVKGIVREVLDSWQEIQDGFVKRRWCVYYDRP